MTRIALAQMEVIPGQVQANLSNALLLLQEAREKSADLVVFPELCLSGYLVGDLWEEQAFIRECREAGRELIAASQGIVILFGNIGECPDGRIGENGRPRVYNAAWLAQDGICVNAPCGLPFFPKTLLPNYREFEETRHFFDTRRLALERGVSLEALLAPVSLVIGGRSVCLGISICEDGWDADYGQSPLRVLAGKGAQILCNLSASPYTRGKAQKRDRVFSAHARSAQVPLIYVNCVGVQNNGKNFFGFDGDSSIYHPGGPTLRAPRWEQALLFWDMDDNDFGASERKYRSEDFDEQDFQCLRFVIARYLSLSGISRVAIGISGGIDSAVSAALFAHVCGPENVLLVSMPGAYSSQTTRRLSRELADRLGCWFSEVSIEPAVSLTRKQLGGLEIRRSSDAERKVLDLTDFHMENVQARDRGSRILAALASAFGGVFSCNANKAEMTVGYSTLYGDLGGFLAPLGDLWKHEVYALGRYLNRVVFHRPVIPEGIFEIKPSAELSAAQNPEQGGGDPLIYWYHDRLFRSWMQVWNRRGPEETLRAYLSGTLETELDLPERLDSIFKSPREFIEDLERWWNLFKGMGVVKRVQSPPIIALSRRAYGYDYRESIMKPWYSREYLRLKVSCLGSIEGLENV